MNPTSSSLPHGNRSHSPLRTGLSRLVFGCLAFARRPELLAFLPAATLAAFWLGGEAALVLTALLVPLVYALAGILGARPGALAPPHAGDGVTGLPLRPALVDRLDALPPASACIALGLDDADRLARQIGHDAWCALLRQTAERIGAALRPQDMVARLDGACFAVALAPLGRPDLETVLQLAARLQEAVEVPLSLDATTVHVTASLGFCLAGRAPVPGGAGLLGAALAAMDDAAHNGPGAIRAHTDDLRRHRADREELRAELGPALESGAVRAYFQPQVSTDTGEISGFETLVRWEHPDRGLLAPAEFLPDLLDAGLAERLGEVMLGGALRALRQWDRAGLRIPRVAINFSAEELRNPRLPDKVQWELDRFGLTPDRLVVEIRESVLARAGDDVVAQSLARIGRIGCGIDLDDFGVDRASIAAIRRFAVGRLKIDRSFVARVDTDPEQQRVLAALLSMAERLTLGTVAEGVETPGEHAVLSQLGCDHVQGYVIAHPMPAEEAGAWIAAYRARIDQALATSKRNG